MQLTGALVSIALQAECEMDFFSRYINVWRDFVHNYKKITSLRWLLLGIIVGIFSGLAAVLFYLGIEWLKHVFIAKFAGVSLPAPNGEALFHGEPGETLRLWVIPTLLTSVGLLTGWLVKRYIPDAVHSGTDGTDAMIKAFHAQDGKISPKVPIIRGITSILTITTGGSAGREGPISQIGAGIGSWIATRLGLSARERRILLLSGAAGGLGAIFRAPLGGALTAIEVIYKEDFEAEGILPSVISSVVAYSIFTLFYGTDPIFGIPRFQFHHARELPFYVLLAVACSIAGWVYIRSFYFIKYSVFQRINDRVGIMWTMALGGLLMGLMGAFWPHLLTGGYGWLELAILGELSAAMMLAIVFGKIMATSVTIGSGMSGGMFAPALFVGGMSGGLVGKLANQYYPTIVPEPGGYVLVGMAAFFAGVANAPIGPLIMVTELTQGYGLLAPLMLASAICLILCRKLSLYENQVENKFESPAHVEDATINILEDLQVKDFYKPGKATVLEETTTLKALTSIIVETNELSFPVRDAEGNISGILPLQDVRRVLFEECLFDLVVVGDLKRKPMTLLPDDDLYTALLRFVDTNYDQIPVIDPVNDKTILGLINRDDVFMAYRNTIKDIKGQA